MNDFPDPTHMRRALTLARAHAGKTGPNPSVGCVIVKGGRIIGEAATAEGGRPHAETQALDASGAAATGADVYVTLEPCAHFGVTPPCADALISAGVRRVAIAIADPDPRTNGGGADRLRKAGIIVSLGLCEDDARAVNATFFSRFEG